MSGPAELSIWTGALLDAGLKATAVLGAGGLLSWALRGRSAAARHAVWAVTLGVLPALPLLARARGPEIAVDRPWVLAVWAIGAGVALAPLLRGLWALRGFDRGSPGRVRILRSDAVESPLTWGFARPIVLMPTTTDSWSPELREAALQHELAHVRRGDWLIHVLAHVVAAAFWFHPLVWIARRQLALEAEHAADDAVLHSGIAPSAYAELLVRMATRRTPAALGAGSHVGQRVHAILGRRRRSPRRGAAALVALFLAVATVPALAAWPTWTAAPETLTCSPELP